MLMDQALEKKERAMHHQYKSKVQYFYVFHGRNQEFHSVESKFCVIYAFLANQIIKLGSLEDVLLLHLNLN